MSAKETSEHSPRSEKKRRKTPKGTTEQTPEPEKEVKKTPLDRNALIITIITVIGSILAALIASPLLERLVSTGPTPSPIIPTIEATVTQFVPTQISTPLISPEDRVDKGVPMVFVPAGKFMMGGINYDREMPLHEVYLDAYLIDKYEVTNSFYKACVDSGSCQPPKDLSKYNDPNYAYHPVVYITWSMAKSYCEWRGARLPTEAEWEKASRGTDDRTYPWGEVLDITKANYNESVGDTTSVGTYESGKSPYGAYDMSGNVYEWVSDWYLPNYYLIVGDNASNPLGPPNPPYEPTDNNYGRVLRGARWTTSNGAHLRSAYRNWDHPETFSSTYGFRCARSESLTASETPTVADQDFLTNITDNMGVQMALVPAGEFTMGSANRDDDEKPVHTIFLDAFYMDIYEVTNAFYKACVDARVCSAPHSLNSSTRTDYYDNPQFDNYPVVKVDWNMANTYCEWRGARLSTEAEWEKAARGTDERTFPWGEGVDVTFANYDENIGDTTAVGSYESGKSPYGMYDMAGNVYEWVADWYLDSYYLGSPPSNPTGPSQTEEHVERGGSWSNSESTLRTTSRNSSLPTEYFSNVGFRCVRDAMP